MTTDSTNDFPNRNRPVHQPLVESHNRTVIVFVTLCTQDRNPALANPAMHQALQTAWSSATHWLVGRYVIMPDHIHLFCAPGTQPAESLKTWVSYWKRLVTQSHGSQLWQKNFWDTQLRSHESYGLKWEYVRNNPVRAGLVVTPEEWPLQGELNVLRWHD